MRPHGLFLVCKDNKFRLQFCLPASYAIPGGTPHSFEVLEGGEVVDVFTPCREDYL